MWRPLTGALGRLTAAALERAARLESQRDALVRLAEQASPRSFLAALQAPGPVRVIAELKRSSPSKGAINTQLVASDRVGEYVAGGAAAISVLTEPTEFGGSNSDLETLAASTAVPLLKKDFHVSELQVIEAAALGASAVLLIARALAPGRLHDLVQTARNVGIEPLVEVRSLEELEQALSSGAQVIGVNARNLETLVIEPDVVERVLSRVPSHCVAIAESGLSGVEDVERVARYGADAVLVGSALSVAASGTAAVAALAGVPRHPRRD